MKKIEEHIFELLFLHDCVILPNFGGFVGCYGHAKIDDKVNRIHPPSKTVIFNKHLLNNDGLLAHKMAAVEGVSYEEALQKITRYVKVLNTTLSTKKRFEIGKIGVLFLDSSKNICFKPSATNFLINSFGLPIVKTIPLTIEKVKIEEPVVVKTKVKPIEIIHETKKLLPETEDKKVISINAPTPLRRRNYWWAAAVLIPVAFYSAWIPMKTDLLNGGANFQYADLNPFTYSKNDVKTYRKYLITDVSEENQDYLTGDLFKESLGDGIYANYSIDDSGHYLTVQLKEIESIFVPETTYVEKEEIEVVEEVFLSNDYFVIGGCFGKKSNANKLVKELKKKGYEAIIVDQNKGLHRVAFGKYKSRKEAKKAKKAILETENLSAWVLKK